MENQEEVGISDLEPIALTLSKMGRQDLAVDILDTFGKYSTEFFQFDNLSKCYFKLKIYDKAVEFGEKALSKTPNEYITRTNLIKIYNHYNYPEKAIKYISINESINPYDSNAKFEKAYSLFLLNKKDEAEKNLIELLHGNLPLNESLKDRLIFNLGTYNLLKDKFQEGLNGFILGGAKVGIWKEKRITDKKFDAPFWKGGSDVDQLIIYPESGFGDEIINVRFMKHLQDLNITPYWYVEQDNSAYTVERKGWLEFLHSNGIKTISSISDIEDRRNLKWTYAMHLPIYLNLEYKDLWEKPYLKCPAKFKSKWKLKNNKVPKIGIRWQGNPLYEQNLHRSYKLSDLYEGLKTIKADFYSLQRDVGLEETKDFPGLVDLSDSLGSIEDTAGVIENLDIVITSCTSIAHLSASMGKETYVFVPISSYYVWCHTGEKSPWYANNVTELRQENPRSWKEPINRLKNFLISKGYNN